MYHACLAHPPLQKLSMDFEFDFIGCSDACSDPEEFQNFLFYSDITPSVKYAPFLEIDHDGLEGEYADGGWLPLVKRHAMNWARKHNFMFPATIWVLPTPSLNFGYIGMSIYLAAFGFPTSFLPDLHRYLARRLGNTHLRFDAEEVITMKDEQDWAPQVHIQYAKAWTQWAEEDPVWREIEFFKKD